MYNLRCISISFVIDHKLHLIHLILYILANVGYEEKVPTGIFAAVAKAFSDTNQFQGSTEELRDRLVISL